MLNSRDISLLRPDVEANCRRWIALCQENGLNVLVTNTVRDNEYQEYLYHQGRTRDGKIVTHSMIPTFHSVDAGLAFDFCKNVKGHEYDDIQFFERAGAIAKKIGFTWGGDWRTFPDRPHIQWDYNGEYTTAMVIAGNYPPTMPQWMGESQKGRENMERFKEVSDCPAWARETVKKLIANGYLSGGDNGLDLSLDMVRLLVINDRAGAYDK